MTYMPVSIVGGQSKPWIAAAGDRRKAERACQALARDYREVHLERFPIGQPLRTETVAVWRDGRQVQ